MPEDPAADRNVKDPKGMADMFGFGSAVESGQGKPKQAPASPLQVKPQDALTSAYNDWRRTPGPETMGKVLKAADPVVSSAASTHTTGDSPLIRGHARIIVAKAVQSYDPSSKASLHTWIAGQLRGLSRYSQSLSPIRAPERVAYDRRELEQASSELRDELDRDPTDDELVERSGLTKKRIKHVRALSRPTVSESEMTDEDGDPILPGVSSQSPEEVYARYVYHDLDPVSQQVYDMKLGRNGRPAMGVTDIAKALKLSPGAVSQRADRISRKLQEYQP